MQPQQEAPKGELSKGLSCHKDLSVCVVLTVETSRPRLEAVIGAGALVRCGVALDWDVPLN